MVPKNVGDFARLLLLRVEVLNGVGGVRISRGLRFILDRITREGKGEQLSAVNRLAPRRFRCNERAVSGGAVWVEFDKGDT